MPVAASVSEPLAAGFRDHHGVLDLHLKKILGRTRVNQGTAVTINRPANSAPKNGAKERNTLPTSISAKVQAIKMPMPTGGRKSPIPKDATTSIPKWRGSIPSWVTTGRKMGARINMAGTPSSTAPRGCRPFQVSRTPRAGRAILKRQRVVLSGWIGEPRGLSLMFSWRPLHLFWASPPLE